MIVAGTDPAPRRSVAELRKSFQQKSAVAAVAAPRPRQDTISGAKVQPSARGQISAVVHEEGGDAPRSALTRENTIGEAEVRPTVRGEISAAVRGASKPDALEADFRALRKQRSGGLRDGAPQ